MEKEQQKIPCSMSQLRVRTCVQNFAGDDRKVKAGGGAVQMRKKGNRSVDLHEETYKTLG